jgi:alkylhydroperoxidase/carboxymuconolactone decarboxylase family protein YurZ
MGGLAGDQHRAVAAATPEEEHMDPITPHLDRAGRRARRAHLDHLIQALPLQGPRALRETAHALFADGALSRKHKELTALAVAVATNCWE